MAIAIVQSEDNMEEVDEKTVVISLILLHTWRLFTGFPVTVPLVWICFAVTQ